MEQVAFDARLYNGFGFLIGSSIPEENSSELLRDDRSNAIVKSSLAFSEKTGVFEESLGGDFSVLATSVRQYGYLNYKGNDWWLIVESPTYIAFSAARKEVIQITAVATVISLLSAIGIFFAINRSIVSPIASLTRTTDLISKGNLKKRAKIYSRDEIGKLAESFNAMTDKLVEARELPETIIHSLHDGLLVIREDGKVGLVNSKAEKILVLNKNEIIGKDTDELKGFGNSSILAKIVESDDQVEREVSLIGGVTVEVADIPIGKRRRMIVLHDITREKTIELLKSEFVSIVAHQLRTPLSAVKWAIGFFTEDASNLTEDQKDMISKAYQSNERMIRLVNDLLDVTRIEEGRYISSPKPSDIVEIVESGISGLRELARNSKIKLSFSRPKEKLEKVLVDPQSVKLVIQNLVENAIFYTPQGGKVKILLTREDGKIMVIVQDTGIGISEEERDRIFTKFFRGKRALQIVTDGSGLGLFIAEHIVESHGGKLWFESKEGEGTNFYFTLPVA